ncbi:hypothetical protein [Limosilactobacillus vaginalis]|uniref:hypothetical protein n=1 Tax=Limosilactobacillus vaginalis TaxID=1633 RepID=UPI0022E189CF|nr:hypothetical protein [Limosilactobacillus vaginalis]
MQVNLANYYYDNLTSIYQRIKKLEGIINTVFMPDGLDTPSLEVNPMPTQILNRSAYLWTLGCMRQLQDVIDWLVGTFNGYNLVDFTTGESTAKVNLWKPNSLMINDNYWQQLQNNFDRVNKLLDQLEKYAEPYVKG